MRNILLIALILQFFAGCQKDKDTYFDTTINISELNFEPTAGGCIVHYSIPEGKDIYSINISYKNHLGIEKVVSGSYLSTQMVIKGFINRENNVAANVYYLSVDGNKSKPQPVTFKTNPAAANLVFETLDVRPYWAGFSIHYEIDSNVDGFINIGYRSTDNNNGEGKIILKDTRPIAKGKNQILYSDIKNDDNALEVIVWTEDFAQNEVKRKSFTIYPKLTKKLDYSNLTYTGDTYENKLKKISHVCLFDGDTKGTQKMVDNLNDYVFLTNSSYLMRPEGIIDLQKQYTLAYFRLYVPLNLSYTYNSAASYKEKMTPNHFEIYASNSKDTPKDEWVKLGSFYQNRLLFEQFWWNYRQFSPTEKYDSLKALEAADPCFVDVAFEVSEVKYRYVKVVFIETFGGDSYYGGKVIASEMEVYVEK